jgi:hypothetical protein
MILCGTWALWILAYGVLGSSASAWADIVLGQKEVRRQIFLREDDDSI